jgi:hypothetical protein
MNTLLYIWQLPQYLLGLLFRRLWRKHTVGMFVFNGIFVYKIDLRYGVSFGPIIFVHKDQPVQTIKHESGHSRQSVYFGPLYLIVVGIPSAVFNNLWDRLFHKDWPAKDRHRWYYSRYPERWADRLGGVARNYRQ